jgi:hypothetical protein
MPLPASPYDWMSIEIAATARSPQYSSTRVDDVVVKYVSYGPTTPPREPCVTGKIGQDGYDESCEEI